MTKELPCVQNKTAPAGEFITAYTTQERSDGIPTTNIGSKNLTTPPRQVTFSKFLQSCRTTPTLLLLNIYYFYTKSNFLFSLKLFLTFIFQAHGYLDIRYSTISFEF